MRPRPPCQECQNLQRLLITRLGISQSFSPYTHLRYTTHFGEKNYVVQLANHTLTFIDAPGYVDEESKRLGKSQTYESWKPLAGGTLEFMKRFKQGAYSIAYPFFKLLRLHQTITRNRSSSSLTFLSIGQMAAVVVLYASVEPFAQGSGPDTKTR